MLSAVIAGQSGSCSVDRGHSAAEPLFRSKGGKGWMIYDRERNGPAYIGDYMAANLTKERAEQLLRSLTDSRAKPAD